MLVKEVVKIKKDVRCLCYSCRQNYILSGYSLKRNGYQYKKTKCDICNRYGYEYIIEKQRKG